MRRVGLGPQGDSLDHDRGVDRSNHGVEGSLSVGDFQTLSEGIRGVQEDVRRIERAVTTMTARLENTVHRMGRELSSTIQRLGDQVSRLITRRESSPVPMGVRPRTRERSRSPGSEGSQNTCFGCGEAGHFIRECPVSSRASIRGRQDFLVGPGQEAKPQP